MKIAESLGSHAQRHARRYVGCHASILTCPAYFFLLGFLILAACSSETPVPISPTPPVSSGVPATPPAATIPAVRPPISNASQADGYKRDIAHWISQRSNVHVYVGQPQALLRGVVVLSIQVDDQGTVRNVRTLRSPGDIALEQRAISSVWQASPLPRPTTAVLRGQRTFEFSETWLFNNDGRFQLRSIALTQKTTNF